MMCSLEAYLANPETIMRARVYVGGRAKGWSDERIIRAQQFLAMRRAKARETSTPEKPQNPPRSPADGSI